MEHGTSDWFKIMKGVHEGHILSPCLFNFYSEYIIQKCQAGWIKSWNKLAGRNINNLRHAVDSTLMAESEEELKSLLIRVKEQSEKSGLKLNIKKTMIMASGAITSGQIEWEKVEAVTSFLSLGSKITADGDCSHGIKRPLLLGMEAMANLDSVLKSKDITLSTKFCKAKAMYSPLVKYRCESWSIKKAEHWSIDALELWWWRRLLRVPWTARRWNQSILKEISSKYSLEGLMLKLNLQYFGQLMTHWKRPWFWERLKAGEEESNRGWDGWMASLT